jgi:hypothetical protein
MTTANKTRLRTKKPTPLSTHALAAFLTWKQHDLLCLIRDGESVNTAMLSEGLDDIKTFDMTHGGAFYVGTDYSATYSSLKRMEERQLVGRFIASTGFVEWSLTKRARKALSGLGS